MSLLYSIVQVSTHHKPVSLGNLVFMIALATNFYMLRTDPKTWYAHWILQKHHVLTSTVRYCSWLLDGLMFKLIMPALCWLTKLPIIPKQCQHIVLVPTRQYTWVCLKMYQLDYSLSKRALITHFVSIWKYVRSKSVNVVENHFPQFSHTRQNSTISATAVLACAFPFYHCKECSKLYSVTKGSMTWSKEIVLSQSWLISW